MLKEQFDKLMENPDILYIYEIGLQIYGLFEDVDDREFLIITKNDFDKSDLQSDEFSVITMDEWFKMVLDGKMLAWECACLPKKYIHKEYVKLLLLTNPLQLRKDFDYNYKTKLSIAIKCIESKNTLTAQRILWDIVKQAKFSNQIIENHKIVNFKTVQDDYKHIVDGQITEKDEILRIFGERLTKPRQLLKNYTDKALQYSKIAKINQDEK